MRIIKFRNSMRVRRKERNITVGEWPIVLTDTTANIKDFKNVVPGWILNFFFFRVRVSDGCNCKKPGLWIELHTSEAKYEHVSIECCQKPREKDLTQSTEIYSYTRVSFVVLQSLSHVWLFATPWTAYSMSDFAVFHHLPELAQTHIHWVGNAFYIELWQSYIHLFFFLITLRV